MHHKKFFVTAAYILYVEFFSKKTFATNSVYFNIYYNDHLGRSQAFFANFGLRTGWMGFGFFLFSLLCAIMKPNG